MQSWFQILSFIFICVLVLIASFPISKIDQPWSIAREQIFHNLKAAFGAYGVKLCSKKRQLYTNTNRAVKSNERSGEHRSGRFVHK